MIVWLASARLAGCFQPRAACAKVLNPQSLVRRSSQLGIGRLIVLGPLTDGVAGNELAYNCWFARCGSRVLGVGRRPLHGEVCRGLFRPGVPWLAER